MEYQDWDIERDSDINRLLNACNFKETDRVPNFDSVMKRSMKYILGEEYIKKIIYSKELMRLLSIYSDLESEEKNEITSEMLWQTFEQEEWSNVELPPADNLELLKRTGVDAAVPMLTWMPQIESRVKNPKVITYDQKGMKQEDLKKIKIPIHKVDRMMELVDWYIKVFKNTGVGIGPMCRSSFCNTYEVIGMEKFLIKLLRDRNLIEHIMDIFTDYSIQITEGLSKRKIDCFWLDDDLCSSHGLLASPKIIKELWIPRTNKILEPLKEKGIPIYMHCCGNVTEVIPILIEMGITALHPIQPNCNDIFALKKKYEKKMTLVGNMDLGGVLSFGTPDEVVKATQEHIRRLSPGGGYVLASSHSIIESVPPENYLAMIKTAQTEGKHKSQ